MFGVKYTAVVPKSNSSLQFDRLNLCDESKAVLMEQLPDTVASLGNSDLDGLRADCRDSDNLVADDRDDLVGAAAR